MVEVKMMIPENCMECRFKNYCTQSAYGLGLCKYKIAIETMGQLKMEEADLKRKEQNNEVIL